MAVSKLAYYPGCPSETHAIEQDMSTKAIFEKLGIELVEVEDWNCCGAAEAENPEMVYALNARNLAIAERDNLDMMVTSCSVCFYNLARTNEAYEKDADLKDRMKAIDPSLEYNGSVKAKHVVDVIVNEVGLDEIAKRIEKKVPVKVAPYYGCYMGRPSRLGFDDPDNPETMDKIIELLGGEVIPYSQMKTKCCGGPLMMTRSDLAFKMSKNLIDAAKDRGADCIVTACPLCHMMLDAKQPDIEETFDVKLEMPVLYFTQILGLGLGIDPKKLGMNKNIISTDAIVEKVI
jgi:heterodisulfide reductase subunit B